MTDTVRRPDWGTLDYQARVDFNGPTSRNYDAGNLPADDDPGWAQWRDAETGKLVRLINVHGPFTTPEHRYGERCEDGYLALDSKGKPFAVDAEYVRPENGNEFNERVRPVGYEPA